MNEPNPHEVQAPFDAMPAPPPETARADTAVAVKGFRIALRQRHWLALIGLALVAAGIGQSIGLSMWFDGRRSDLSPNHDRGQSVVVPPIAAAPIVPVAKGDNAPAPADVTEATAAPAATDTRPQHVLDVGRERLAQGDAEGARRIAAQYLLRLDGFGHDDSGRAPEASALLGDVLRRDYERSLDRVNRVPPVMPAAPATGDGK